eukprot:Hpha_TRINITY_DN19698_c0_g1::TRINITY_DN19698_c0_g1_i1::g.186286::m.186286/K20300/TRAPPC1, BET5; trafficking protein particle complex subunit 1
MLYSLFIFNRFGDCIFHAEYHPRHSPAPRGEYKLVAGLVYSLCGFVQQLSRKERGEDEVLKCFRTTGYGLHYSATLTGYRFVVLTDPCVATSEVEQAMRSILNPVFVDYVVKDPTYVHARGSVVTSQLFREQLEKRLEGVNFFRSPAGTLDSLHRDKGP